MDKSQIINSKQPLIEMGALFSKSWEIYKENFWRLVGVFVWPNLLAVIGGIIIGIVSLIAVGSAVAGFIPLLLSAGVIGIIIYIIVLLGAALGAAALLYLIIHRAEKIGVIDCYKKALSLFFPYLLIYIMFWLVILVGSIFLIIPGIIFYIYLNFSFFVLVEEGTKGVKALSRSKKLVKGYWWQVFLREIVIMIVLFVSAWVIGQIPVIGFSLGLVLATPFVLIFSYLIYKDLKRIKQPEKVA